MTSTYICEFWMLPPPSLMFCMMHYIRMDDISIMLSYNCCSKNSYVFKDDLGVSEMPSQVSPFCHKLLSCPILSESKCHTLCQ